MEVRIIKSDEIISISRKYEYFFWHVYPKKWMSTELFSYFYHPDVDCVKDRHPLREIVDTLQIPFFESYMEDEYEFVSNLVSGFHKKLWTAKEGFKPVILGFHNGIVKTHTQGMFCYCSEGFVDLIYNTNPNFIEDNLD